MKNKKMNIFLLPIISLLIFLYLLIQIGYKVDFIAFTPYLKFYDRYLLISLLISILVLVLTYFIRNRTLIRVSNTVLVILCIGAFFLEFNYSLTVEYDEDANIADITWEELEEYRNEDQYYFLYVGWNSSQDCVEFYDELKHLSRDNDFTVLYYEITEDDEINSYDKELEKLNSVEVPATYIIGQDDLILVDTTDVLSDELKNIIATYDLR